MNSETAVLCQQLSKKYKEVHALKPLDLEVKAGSIFGFLGRNGAGKTTTIRLLTGLATPTSGAAWVGGVQTTQADSAARAHFGYLPQSPSFYKWMTPVAYLDYVGQILQMDKPTRQQRIDEMLELAGLTDARKRPIRGFSGGMIQRLGVAQAMLHKPPVLFLDEPTSALDPAGRHELLSLIEQLRGEVTVFFSSHILGDVERVCDTVGIIHEGELLLVEDRETLLNRYVSDVVELTVLSESSSQIEPFVTAVSQLDWVVLAVNEDDVVRVRVSDTAVAQEAILPLVVTHHLHLKKFEWKRPSLEEIFLTMSEKSGK